MSNPAIAFLEAKTGKDRFLKLTKQYGGRNLFVPKRIKPDHVLHQMLDEASRKILCHSYGGEYIYVPMEKKERTERDRRNEDIVLLKNAGYSTISIAKNFNLSPRRVQKIITLKNSKN